MLEFQLAMARSFLSQLLRGVVVCVFDDHGARSWVCGHFSYLLGGGRSDASAGHQLFAARC